MLFFKKFQAKKKCIEGVEAKLKTHDSAICLLIKQVGVKDIAILIGKDTCFKHLNIAYFDKKLPIFRNVKMFLKIFRMKN